MIFLEEGRAVSGNSYLMTAMTITIVWLLFDHIVRKNCPLFDYQVLLQLRKSLKEVIAAVEVWFPNQAKLEVLFGFVIQN